MNDMRLEKIQYPKLRRYADNRSTTCYIDFLRGALKLKAKYPMCDFFQVNEVLHCASLVITPNLSEDNFWYYKEYVNIDMNDVIDMVSIIYKWIDQSISFEWMINPAKTSP